MVGTNALDPNRFPMVITRQREIRGGIARRRAAALPSSLKPGKLKEQRQFPADVGTFPEAKALLEQFRTVESAGSHAVKAGVSENIEQILSSPGLRKLLKPPTEIEEELRKILAGELPTPEAYPRTREKNKEPPAEFLRRIWGKFIDDGCLYLNDLGTIDPGLVQAIRNWDSYRGVDSASFILNGDQRIDSYVEGLPDYLIERIKWIGGALGVRERNREYRKRKDKEKGM